MYIISYSAFLAEGNSTILFKNNAATNGGEIFSIKNSIFIFQKHAFVTFYSNVANYIGGGAHITDDSQIAFKENSMVIFNVNVAVDTGASISAQSSNITIEGNALVTFNNGHAKHRQGGGISFISHSVVSVSGNSSVGFYNNAAMFGGAIDCIGNSNITVYGNSTVTFNNNKAKFAGGVVRFMTCNSTFTGQSTGWWGYVSSQTVPICSNR